MLWGFLSGFLQKFCDSYAYQNCFQDSPNSLFLTSSEVRFLWDFKKNSGGSSWMNTGRSYCRILRGILVGLPKRIPDGVHEYEGIQETNPEGIPDFPDDFWKEFQKESRKKFQE